VKRIPMKSNDPYTRADQNRFTLRVDSELLEKIKIDAAKNKRSMVKHIEFILEQYVNGLSEQ